MEDEAGGRDCVGDGGYGIRDAGYEMRDAGCGMRDTRCGIVVRGKLIPK
jgi:hypothetical protein